MSKSMLDYTKSVLKRVSFDVTLFCKELEKACRVLLPYELEELTSWLLQFTKEKPELRHCLLQISNIKKELKWFLFCLCKI
jgi:DNA replication protein DnaD